MERAVLECISSSFRYLAKPSSSEETITRPVLSNIMDLLLRQANVAMLTRASSEDIAQHINFKLCSTSSKPEPGIHVGDCFLLVSEAKGVNASASECLPQAFQIGADAALQLAQTLAIERCVVVMLTTFAEHVQFFASFLLPSSFPCACALSEPLCLSSRAGRAEVARWLQACSEWLREMVGFIAEAQKTRSRSCSTEKAPTLSTSSVFLKPVRLRALLDLPRHGGRPEEDRRPFRVAMTHLLEVYQALHGVPQCHSFVAFPLGWCQLPAESPGPQQHKQYKEAILASLHERFTGDDLACPFLAFPRLPVPSEIIPPTAEQRVQYIQKLRLAVSAMAVAKVVHMDLRPENILWSWAGDPPELKLTVLDWDDAFFAGEIVPAHVARSFGTDQWKRYPDIGVEAQPAMLEWNQWFAELIEGFVLSGASSFSKYTQFRSGGKEPAMKVPRLSSSSVSPGGQP